MAPILKNLASALERRDAQPNVEVALALVAKPNSAAMKPLVEALTSAPRPLQHDAIKVLYEIGRRKPELLVPYHAALFALLRRRDNRLLWGALQVIDSIAATCPAEVYGQLSAVLAAADRGSVIAKDKTMSILCTLISAATGRRAVKAYLERLKVSATNQFPTYAEWGAKVLSRKDLTDLQKILQDRLPTLPATKHRRVEKLLKRLAERQTT